MNHPILLKIGPVAIHSYGFFLTSAIVSGTFLFWRGAKREGFDEERVLDLVLASLVSGLLGARLVFVLINFSVFRGDFLDIFRSFSAGLSFFGGLVFGLLGFTLFVRRVGWSFWKLLDLAAPALAFSHGLALVGSTLSDSSVPLLAEMFGHFLIFIGFTFLANPALSISGRFDILNKTGFLASLYFFLSGTVRSAIGFYWIRSTGTPLTPAQVCSGLEMLIGGLALGWWGFSKQFKEVLDKTLHFES